MIARSNPASPMPISGDPRHKSTTCGHIDVRPESPGLTTTTIAATTSAGTS